MKMHHTFRNGYMHLHRNISRHNHLNTFRHRLLLHPIDAVFMPISFPQKRKSGMTFMDNDKVSCRNSYSMRCTLFQGLAEVPVTCIFHSDQSGSVSASFCTSLTRCLCRTDHSPSFGRRRPAFPPSECLCTVP